MSVFMYLDKMLAYIFTVKEKPREWILIIGLEYLQARQSLYFASPLVCVHVLSGLNSILKGEHSPHPPWRF